MSTIVLGNGKAQDKAIRIVNIMILFFGILYLVPKFAMYDMLIVVSLVVGFIAALIIMAVLEHQDSGSSGSNRPNRNN